jgi:hypothetical protein
MSTDRTEFFKKLLSEGIEKIKSLKKLSEAVDPNNPAAADPSLGAPPAPAGMPPQAPQSAAPANPEPAQPPAPELNVDTLVLKLNGIRRGTSFKDAPMYDQLGSFYNSQSEQDKQTLDRMLSQIGQIVISNLPQPPAPMAPATPQQAPVAPPMPGQQNPVG